MDAVGSITIVARAVDLREGLPSHHQTASIPWNDPRLVRARMEATAQSLSATAAAKSAGSGPAGATAVTTAGASSVAARNADDDAFAGVLRAVWVHLSDWPPSSTPSPTPLLDLTACPADCIVPYCPNLSDRGPKVIG